MARLNLYKPIPSDPSDWFDAKEIERARGYNRPLQVFSFIYSTVAFATLAILVTVHAPRRLIHTTGVRSWPLQLLVALAVVLLPLEAVTLPLDMWKRRHLRRWDMAAVPGPVARRFAGEVGGFLAALLLVSVIAFPVWAVIRLTAFWWIYTALFVFGVGVAFSVVIPALLPVFGRISRIEDDDLRSRVRKVSREAGVDVIDVFQSDESRRTPLQGGYIAGVGRGRKLVLYDNLLSRPPAEIDVFLARKISHIRRRHAPLRVGVLVLLIGAQFGLVRLALGWAPLLRIAGVSGVREPAALPLFILVVGATLIVVEVGAAWVQRAHDRIANLDALEFTRDADAYAALIRGVNARNREDLAPSWWRRVLSAHPTAAELLALGAWWRARRRVTVLFTDIEDSTATLQRLGDEGWYQLRRDHNEIIREQIATHEGVEVDAAGDGFLIVFEDAGEALLCAVECQQALEAYNREHPDVDLRVRMGLHAGDVIRKGREVIGRDVHVAARVADSASGGEILAAASVRDALAGTDRFTFEAERALELKGFAGTYAVWRVPWARVTESLSP